MVPTLRDIYWVGDRDGRAAAVVGKYAEDTARVHARAYMAWARDAWDLTPRKAVRVLYAYFTGYQVGAQEVRREQRLDHDEHITQRRPS